MVRVEDAPACLARAHELHPDAVVVDLLLPDFIGWEAVRQLKRDAEFADVPVILAASYNFV